MFQPKSAARYRYLLASLMLYFLCTGASYAQLSADFTADKTGGCPPGLQVNFTNTTTGASATATYKWEFGNGRTSTDKSPSAVFTDIKTYTVTLTVKDGAASAAKSTTITVYKLPGIDFTVQNTRGCAPFPVGFTASAAAYDGASISSYLWDFGDGVTEQGAAAAVGHIYTKEQKPAVSVTVTDSHGCVNTSAVKTEVEILIPAKALFGPDKTVLCTTAEQVTFTNQSTAPPVVSYRWDFGDGGTSTDINPSHGYGAKGSYKVKLTVSSTEGCSNTYELPDPISVADFNVDFPVPAIVCTGTPTAFTATVNPAPELITWSFGDGNLAYGNNATNQYNLPGIVDVLLTARYKNCTITATKQVTVNQAPVLNGFVMESSNPCGAPATVTFKDTTKAAVKWTWTIDGSVAGSTQTISNAFNANGIYSIVLAVTDANGCSVEAPARILELAETKASIGYISSTSPTGLVSCEDFTVKFVASSFPEKIATYKWDFGDGGTATDKEPVHTFTKTGYFTVVLSYVTEHGCKGSANALVSLFEKPKVDFSMVNTNPICGNTPVIFLGSSPVDIQYWYWRFEGENSASYSRGPSPVYQYLQEGEYTVQLIGVNGICRDTITKVNYVKVVPPFPKINWSVNSCAGMHTRVTFSESSRQATEWHWDFGDGKTVSYTSYRLSVVHEYEKTGKYNVVLTAINGACAVKDSIPAYVMLKQTPVVTVSKPELCNNDSVRITVTNPEANPNENYKEDFYLSRILYDKTGTPFTGSWRNINNNWEQTYEGMLTGLTAGKDSIQVIIYNNYFGCFDTSAFVKLQVKGPTAAYTMPANHVCFNSPNKFLEQSARPDNVPIVLWEWTYGDGKTELYTKGPEAAHIYAAPGTYYPTLKVTDQDGCYSTVYSPSAKAPAATLTGPQAIFEWSPEIVKPGTTVNYTTILSPFNDPVNTKYNWVFSYDNSTSLLLNPSKKYDNIGVDEVKLMATDVTSGCVDSMVKRIYIKIIHAAFSFTATYVNGNSCPPVLAKFTNLSSDYTRVSWDFGDESAADNLNTPTHTYNKPGRYTIKVYAYDDKGGIDSAEHDIEIKGPFSSFVANPAKICGVPATVHFTANPVNVTDFTWDFADGTVAGSRRFDTAYTYTLPGVYKPAIIVKDALGCSAVFELGDPFMIDTMHVSFNKTPAVICDSANVRFTPTVVNIGANLLHWPLTYHWDFGTGNPEDTSDAVAPAFKYKGSGGEEFKAHLTVHSYAGCVEDVEALISIVRKTKGTITADPEICQFQSADFKSSANGPVHSLKWEFADDDAIASGDAAVTHQYNKPGNYKVLLLVEYEGCTDTASYLLPVHALPDVALVPKNTLLCLGDSVVLAAHNGVQYEWSPATAITNAAAAAPSVFPVTDTRYKVVVTDGHGCVNKDSVQVKLSYPFTITARNDTTICKGDQVQLHATGAVTYRWIRGNNLDNAAIADPVATAAATNIYTVVGYGNDACFTDTADFVITVRPVPVIDAIPDTTLIAGSSVSLSTTGSSDIVRYAWSPGFYLDCNNCAEPLSTPKRHMDYVVTVANQYGCMAKDTVSISLLCVERSVFIPNTFTPNKDSKNDVFYPRGKGIRLVKYFRIYNRLGELIFERSDFMINDAGKGWDGTYMGKQVSNGVFVYTSEMTCDAGETYLMKGNVTLIR